MSKNVDYCCMILMLRQLVAAGYCKKKEAVRIAARLARQTGADVLISL